MADGNVPAASIELPRQEGKDVVAACEIAARATDSDVLDRACQHFRVLITFDRDSGALVFLGQERIPPGVVFLRFEPDAPEEAASVVLGLWDTPGLTLDQRFTVVDRERIRQRRLPGSRRDA